MITYSIQPEMQVQACGKAELAYHIGCGLQNDNYCLTISWTT